MVRLNAGSIALLIIASVVGCTQERHTNARKIVTRTDLLGGPSALGEVGDYLLENEQIRVLVQDKGYSRGFGVFGGGLIDADLVRPTRPGNSAGGTGRDGFGELFPIALVQALEPNSVDIISDGRDGGPAKIRVSGFGGDFLSLTKIINQGVLNSYELPQNPLNLLDAKSLSADPVLTFELDYTLRPGDRHIEMTYRVTNISEEEIQIPPPVVGTLLGLTGIEIDLESFRAPLGWVLLFGAGNEVFSPGTGFGLRFGIEAGQKGPGISKLRFPALPGLLTDALITTSENGVSYGLIAKPEPNKETFIQGQKDADGRSLYELAYNRKITSSTLLVPFEASSFTGVFQGQAPPVFEPGQSIEFSAYFIIGDGDVGSVMDVAYELREIPTAGVTGEVFDELTGEPLVDTAVLIYDQNNRPVNHFFTDQTGRFKGQLPSGSYSARVERDPLLSSPVPFAIRGEQGEHLRLSAPTAGFVSVQVQDSAGRRLPAKVTAVTSTAEKRTNPAPDGYLFEMGIFDPAAGQRWRVEDLIPDTNDPKTRRYIEGTAVTENGKALLALPPNRDFTLIVSRGIEYDIVELPVRVAPGETLNLSARLTQVVDTSGYISADFHLHAAPSPDSDLDLPSRVRSVVAEGVELLVATDHNFVTDYGPTLDELGLRDFASSMVGLEMTTLESGHFNGFPLKRNPGKITGGAFEWSQRPPAELFESIRALGAVEPEDVIIQVNHPRDSILGYFAQYELDALTGQIPVPRDCSDLGVDIIDAVADCLIAPNGAAFRTEDGKLAFSHDFDAIEVLNASTNGQFFHKRVPATLDGLDVPDALVNANPPAGAILCNDDDEVAYPGVMDDWFNLLNLGHRYLGTGTSDSHSATDHAGAGRTFVYVGHDQPAKLTDRSVVEAMRTGRVFASTGPIIEFFVNGQPMGSELTTDEGKVTVEVIVQAAPWIEVNKGIIWVNGNEKASFPIQLVDGQARWTKEIELSGDSWMIAQVYSEQNLFPVYRPADIPPILIDDAVEQIAGPLGFFDDTLGDLQVQYFGPITPMAITNPVYIDVDGGGYRAPGIQERRCVPGEYHAVNVAPQVVSTETINAPLRAKPLLKKSIGFPRLRNNLLDVRVIFEHFGAHGHGH